MKKKILFYLKKLLPIAIIVIGGLFIICKGFIKWDLLKPYLNKIILYEYRVHIVWFFNILIGLSYYCYVGSKRKESKFIIIQTSLPFLDSLLSVLSYGAIINSCFFLANEVVNGNLIGLNFDWLSLFIAVFIILFWSLKRLFDMGKQSWNSYIELPKSQSIQVELNDLASLDYDSKSTVLEIEFKSGRVYKYSGVSQDVYDGLMNAESKGKYFHQYIKNSGYPYSKVR